MDALALLCTLHADGPSTLKNLRQAGCVSLQAIESMEEERLSRVLGGPPAVARRFAREARHLRERLDPGMPDREETHLDPTRVDGESAAILPAPTEAPIEAERDPMADVLEAWRDRDAAEAHAPSVPTPAEPVEAHEDEAPPRAVRARPEFEFSSDIVAAMRDLATNILPAKPVDSPAPQMSVTLVPSDPSSVDGLAGLFEGQALELVVRLGDEGIADLRELTDEDVLDLSNRLGFGYTRILRVVQIARRAATGRSEASEPVFGAGVEGVRLVEIPTATAETRSAPKLSLSDRPRNPRPSILELEWNLEIQPQAPPHGKAAPNSANPEALREDAGGPFA